MGSTTQQAEFTPYKANVNFINEAQRKIAIDIGNSGTSSGQIIQVYTRTSATTTQSQNTAPIALITIVAGDIESLNVTYPWINGAICDFKVVPSSGAASFHKASPTITFFNSSTTANPNSKTHFY